MTVTIDTDDCVEIRRIGLKALNKALGMSGTKAFLRQYTCRRGDYTEEKHENQQLTLNEVLEAMRDVDKEEMDSADCNAAEA